MIFKNIPLMFLWFLLNDYGYLRLCLSPDPPDDPPAGDPPPDDPPQDPPADPPPEDPPPEDPPPETYKEGEKESLAWLGENKETLKSLTPLLEAIQKGDRDAGQNIFDGLIKPPDMREKLDPDDVKGRMDRMEHDAKTQKMEADADRVILAMEKDVEGFDSKAALDLLTASGMVYSQEAFPQQLDMAHKALQFDAQGTSYDQKLADGIKAGVKEALDAIKKEKSASNVFDDDGVGPKEVKERQYGKNTNFFGD